MKRGVAVELAIKSEGMEDTFKDIAVYSTLAMILFRKSENLKELQGKKWTPVDDKYNGDESFTHPMIAMREVAEEQNGESYSLDAQRESILKEKKRLNKILNEMEDDEKAFYKSKIKNAKDN